MSIPWLSVIIPTIGRATLARTLVSVRQQAPAAEVEIVVVGDTHAPHGVQTHREALQAVPAVCDRYQARYVTHNGGSHCVGQQQRERGQAEARGRWLWFLQDDDIATQGAVLDIHAWLRGPTCPRIFRTRTQWGFTVWQFPALALANVDADCLVLPRDRKRLGHWGLRYQGDYDMAAETVALWQGRVQFCEPLIAVARPGLGHDWVRGWQ